MLRWAQVGPRCECGPHLRSGGSISPVPARYMYDETASDSAPREGLMISSHWQFPDQDPWGLVKGMRRSRSSPPAQPCMSRARIGPDHNDNDNIMRPTDATPQTACRRRDSFPNNLEWHLALTSRRLRHWPDLVVRPGGTTAKSGRTAVIKGFESDRHWTSRPVLTSVPLEPRSAST
jgi:hypothetical protein